MGLPFLQFTVALSALVCCCSAAVTQYGEINCVKDQNTNIMTVNLWIYRNGSQAVDVYFYQNATENENTNTDCDWTGTGTVADPWKKTLLVDLATNGTPNNKNSCNREVIVSGDTYAWYVRTYLEKNKHTQHDMFYKFTCNPLTDEVSVDFNINLPDLDVNLETRPGTITLRTIKSLVNLDTVTTIELGESFFVQLRYQPDSLVTYPLRPWGAYCKDLYATPDSNFVNRREHILKSDGCPRTDSMFLKPSGSFKGSKPATADGIYFSYTGSIEAARFDKLPINTPTQGAYPTVYLVCEAVLCYKDVDSNCIDRCPSSNNRRRRSDDSKTFQVVAVLDIVEKSDTSEKSSREYVPIIAGVAGGLVLLIIILATLFFCCRSQKRNRKYNEQTDSSSYSSSVTSEKGRSSSFSYGNQPHQLYANKYRY